jgi:hypothetical protein
MKTSLKAVLALFLLAPFILDGVKYAFGQDVHNAIQSNIASEQHLSEGWTVEKFAALEATVTDLMDTFGSEYPQGPAFLSEIAVKKALYDSLRIRQVPESDPGISGIRESMNALQAKVIRSNPLLNGAPLLITARNRYEQDHHNTHNMFPSYAGEVNNGSYTPGGALRVLDIATGTVLTLAETSDGVFRDPCISYDGDKIVLSYRENAAGTYNIWEYTLSADRKKIVGKKQLTAMSTADDIYPIYMPGGNIVFSSTRDPKYVMCNQHISANLYRMEPDGANIVKITNSTLFERATDVLPDGRIVYDRWEYNDRDFGSAQGLWTVAGDGTQQVTYYGNNSPTGATINARIIPGTQNVMAILSSCHDIDWGALAIIDRNRGVDGSAPVIRTWPDSIRSGIMDTGADNNIDAYGSLTPKYEDPCPLNDKYFLVSRMIDGEKQKMGVFYLDMFGNEMLLYEDESDFGAYDVRVLKPRARENIAPDRRNYLDRPGSFFVQNVYSGTHMEGVAPGSVKTLRIVESSPKYCHTPASWWGEGMQNPGVNWHSFEVKKVIGEVPVYEDGSAYFEAPQDKFVYFQLLDESGRMIQSMRSATLVQSGEKAGCLGCHEDRLAAPATGYSGSAPVALKQRFKAPGDKAPDKPMKRMLDFDAATDSIAAYDEIELPSMNFLTEVQPVFTNNCMSCHGYDAPAADLTLVADKGIVFNASYVDLWRNREKAGVRFGNLLGAIGAGDNRFTAAKGWGSYASPLINKIFNDAEHAARLTDAEKRRLAEWVDLNATYYGDYASNYAYNFGGRSPLSPDDLKAISDCTGEKSAWDNNWGEKRPMPIYFDNPEKSPALKGVTGTNRDSALFLITKGHKQLKADPDVDWAGLTVMPGNPDAVLDRQYLRRATDQWRYDKVLMRDAIEAANRKAIAEGRKRYDNLLDPAPANYLPEWPDRVAQPYPGR